MSHCYLISIILLCIPLLFGAVDANTQWLTTHNNARRAVGLSPLKWDYKLANYAKLYAYKRRYDCALKHSNGPYGENLYWGSSGMRWTPAHAVSAWVSEKRWYNLRTNSCRGPECGHYKQIVWRKSQRVGCASVVCVKGAGVLLFCEYDPPGNYVGEKPY